MIIRLAAKGVIFTIVVGLYIVVLLFPMAATVVALISVLTLLVLLVVSVIDDFFQKKAIESVIALTEELHKPKQKNAEKATPAVWIDPGYAADIESKSDESTENLSQ